MGKSVIFLFFTYNFPKTIICTVLLTYFSQKKTANLELGKHVILWGKFLFLLYIFGTPAAGEFLFLQDCLLLKYGQKPSKYRKDCKFTVKM